jgi:hypothetical protein
MRPTSESTATTDDRRAWRAATIDDSSAWYEPLPESCWDIVKQKLARFRQGALPTTAIEVSPAERAEAAAALGPIHEALESGRGFTIIDGVPLDRYTPAEAQAVYWIVGQLLGVPVFQNVQGTLLYDVRDTGQDVAYGARFSVTSAESSFHTDNSFGTTVVDYVGLLCLQSARSGGLSQNVSGYRAYEELARSEPAVLETLARPFHIDRRGGVQPGEAPTVQFPVLTCNGDALLYRYLRYWIEAGHQKANQPLTQDQLHALDTLDAVLARPDLRIEFTLRPGQMMFINNRWILHNRTAFEDDRAPERRRHYVRLWLAAAGAATGAEAGVPGAVN